MSRLRLLLGLVIIAGCALYFFLPDDEKQIKENLSALADFGSTTGSEAMLDSLQKAGRAVKLCKTPFRIRFSSQQIDRDFNEKELTDRILMVKKRAGAIRFAFEDVQVHITGQKTADVVATLRLEGGTPDDMYTDAYETNLRAVETDGNWLFTSFDIVEFIQR